MKRIINRNDSVKAREEKGPLVVDNYLGIIRIKSLYFDYIERNKQGIINHDFQAEIRLSLSEAIELHNALSQVIMAENKRVIKKAIQRDFDAYKEGNHETK